MAQEGRDEKGRFLPNNRFWEARSSAGPNPIFSGPEDLWEACLEYFEWVEQNPLLEGIAFQGKVAPDGLPKMRAMTVEGLCVFLDIDKTTWFDWRNNRSDLSHVISKVETIIFQQKFEGASAGFLNANLISRHLGLADRQEVSGKDGEPIKTEVKASDQLKEFLDVVSKRSGKTSETS